MPGKLSAVSLIVFLAVISVFAGGCPGGSGSDPGDSCGPDLDGDGLRACQEVINGTDPLLYDTDGDGVGDGVEVSMGANPLDPAVVMGSTLAAGTTVLVESGGDFPISLEWTGSEYGLAWNDARDDPDCVYSGTYGYLLCEDEAYFARISSEGLKLGEDVRIIYGTTGDDMTDISWNGSGFGAVFFTQHESYYEKSVQFIGLSLDGDTLGPAVRITGDDWYGFPLLSWTGSEYGVSFNKAHGPNVWDPCDLLFSRVSIDGSTLGQPIVLDSFSEYNFARNHVWTGSEFGIVWPYYDFSVGTSIRFNRISAQGEVIHPEPLTIIPSGPTKSSPFIAWTGSEYALIWSDFRDDADGKCDTDSGAMDCNHEIYFVRLSVSGDTLGPELRITHTPNESWGRLSWTGYFYGLAWAEVYEPYDYGPSEIFFALIGADGSTIGSPISLSGGTFYYNNYPELEWTGSEFGVAWGSNQQTDWGAWEKIHFARISIDFDGDGLGPADEAAHNTDPFDWDTDDDGFSDGDEVNTYGTDPLDPDTDAALVRYQ